MSGRPIRAENGNIIGSILVQRAVSNSFVDGIKKDTGLDSSVYGFNQRSATTLTTPDGLNRAVGLRETSSQVNATVLKSGRSLTTDTSFNSRLYLTGYAPLKDADNNTVGMLMVAKPADSLLATAGRSVQLAFSVAVTLLLLSIYPVYRVAKKISNSIR